MTIPEGRLSDSARARRRAELMEAITSDDRGRRWIAPVAAAAVVAVVGGAAYGVTALRGSGPGEAEPAGSGSGSVGETVASETQAAPTTSAPTEEACESEAPGSARRMMGQSMRQQMADYREQLPVVQGFRDVLAAHLDPRGEHLERKASNVQSSGSACSLTALGTKVGWATPGASGLGMVQVEVSTGGDLTQVHMAHGGWRRLPVDVAGIASAEQVQYDGGFAVQVVRDDGLTVAIDANLLFGNNSLEPIDAFPFGVAELVETAADPALKLP
ncbi:hypothetical protein HNR19_000722 [Nocardioides thalensis]|uniref:Uncharacterized protein n=1 Tax=Nocardioides thalensis TaxID=1914755 RepID=A0A853BY91_9ACTN|nr:hypothetical protein [Nocardioides thalensis]NYJ00024.1 hypothetical protein [Nocardioides thalensis]